MGIRFQYYDMFQLLEKGHYLVQLGDSNPNYWLDGHMSANILAPEFIKKGWVRRTISEDNGCRVFYCLSTDGEKILADGKDWYNNLPLWYKILGRFF